MQRSILLGVALLNIATGFQIFFAPEFFYNTVPGVSMMGPYNVHFIRDAGLAYAASGALLVLGWRRADYTLALAGALWPCLHALFHLQMWIARGVPADLVALVNLVGIQLPAWATFFVALALYNRPDRNDTKGVAHD